MFPGEPVYTMDLLAIIEKNGFSNFVQKLVLWDGRPGSLLSLTFPSLGRRASHLLPVTAAVATGSGPQRRRRTLHDISNGLGNHSLFYPVNIQG
jgi:hypothetical protein